jgi:hypothetical protein
MALGWIAFVGLGAGWPPVVVSIFCVTTGFGLAEAAFRRLADHKTVRRDLEERVRGDRF